MDICIYIPYGTQIIGEDDIDAVIKMLRSGFLTTSLDIEKLDTIAEYSGADYKGRRIGSISGMDTFRFYLVKYIITAKGGLIIIDSEEFSEKLLLSRSYGITRNKKFMRKNEGY